MNATTTPIHPIHVDEDGNRVRVGVIVWTIDPEGTKRFFIRHNRPFYGYRDEWNMIFGSVEPNEDIDIAVMREVFEESGLIVERHDIIDLNYQLNYNATNGPTVIHFFGAKVRSIDIRICLNEESIGYDWATLREVTLRVPYSEQVKAFEIIV